MASHGKCNNKKRKKGMLSSGAALLSCIFVFFLSACGGNHTDIGEEQEASEEVFVYIPQWQQLDLGYRDEDYLGGWTLAGDNLYYSYNVKSEAGQKETYIGRMNLISLEEPEIRKQGEGRILDLFTDSEQDLWCLRIVGEEEGMQRKWLIEKGIPGESGFVQIDATKHLEGIVMLIDIVVDEKGYIYCLVGTPTPVLKVLDQNGTCIRTVEKLYDVSSMDVWEGRGVLLASYANYAHIFTLEAQTPAMSEEIYNKTGRLKVSVQEDGSVLFVNGSSLICLSGEKESEELANLTSCNIMTDSIEGMNTLSDGRIAILLWDSAQANRLEVVCLKKVPENEIPQKKSVRLGTVTADTALNAAVIEFNKRSTECQIEIVPYNPEELRSLGQDAATGQGPDLIDLRNVAGNDLEVYLEKGILEDLTPYLQADESISQEDFLPNFLESYTREGVLYAIPDSFQISTLVGKTSEVGETFGWTPQEFMDFAADCPEESMLMQYESKSQIFQDLFERQADSFIDREKGECRLDCEELKELLEFANQYPSDFQELSYDQIPQLLREGGLKLYRASIAGMLDVQMINRNFGEPVTYIGYPAPEGTSGSYFAESGLLFGINSSSDCKEEAWSFIRIWLDKEVQLRNVKDAMQGFSAFPSRRDALEEVLNASMEARYKQDENGELIEVPVYTVYEYTADGNVLETAFYAATQEEVDAVKKLLFSITNNEVRNQEVQIIVMEEADAYFSGQKSLDDAVSIMQNRVQLYLNERPGA